MAPRIIGVLAKEVKIGCQDNPKCVSDFSSGFSVRLMFGACKQAVGSFLMRKPLCVYL